MKKKVKVLCRLVKLRNNFHEVTMGDFTVWFSYETPIAFKTYDGIVHICKNEWGRTTAKHINSIKNMWDCHESSRSDFEAELKLYGL